MKFSSQIKPISYLKSHTAEVVRTFETDRTPLIITQNGEAKFVVQDVRDYEEKEETLALLALLPSANVRSKKARACRWRNFAKRWRTISRNNDHDSSASTKRPI